MPWARLEFVWSIVAILLVPALVRPGDQPNFDRWEKEIAALETKDKEKLPPQNGIIFVGSSSIRLWNLAKSFPDLALDNRGFGGSQIIDSTHFAPRIILKHRPRLVVLYAGDNDIAAGKSPERVCNDFKEFVKVIHAELPKTNIAYISIKPSIQRWALWGKMRKANELIAAYCKEHEHLKFIDISEAMLGANGEPKRELLLPDGLHLNGKGYEVWAEIVKPHLRERDDTLPRFTRKARPNVLFILADDQRFDTIHALGNAEIQTPNLDRLVERGFVLSNTYCQGGLVPAVCTPSRTMLLSGRSLFRIPNPSAKNYDGPTLASVFNEAGYATLHVGKRGNSFIAGMEAFQKVVYSHGGSGRVVRQEDQAQFVADEAIQFLRAHKANKPFLIYLAPQCPHDPRVAPKRFMAMYDPSKLTLAKNFMPKHPFDNGELDVRDERLAPIPRTEAEMRRHLADYYASITCLDHHVGRILDTLQETGHAENTFIVFTSDQGLAVGGRHGLMGKQNLYEHFKSPLIVAGPGVPHGKSDVLVYLFDLFPTLCDLTQVAIPKGLDGATLAPVIKGDRPRVREWLFAAYRDCQRMVRNERWKLIWYPKIDRYQLFDLMYDPWEVDDLSEKREHAGHLLDLKKRLAEQQKAWSDDLAVSSQ